METLTSGKDLLFLLVLKVGLAGSMAAKSASAPPPRFAGFEKHLARL